MLKRLIVVSTLAALVAVAGASAAESAEATEATPAPESAPSVQSRMIWFWSECQFLVAITDAECARNEESQACAEAYWAWEEACYSPLDDVAYC